MAPLRSPYLAPTLPSSGLHSRRHSNTILTLIYYRACTYTYTYTYTFTYTCTYTYTHTHAYAYAYYTCTLPALTEALKFA